MSRYKVLRKMDCDVLTAAVIAFLNFATGVPKGIIRVLSVEVEYDA